MQQRLSSLSHIPRWIDTLWLTMLTLYICAGIYLIPFHGDESTQIYMGRDYYYHLVQQDWQQLLYSKASLNPTEQHLRLLNGTIPKYFFGWAANRLGYDIDEINEQWDWGADWHYNRDTGRIPPDDLLLDARLLSTLLLVGSTIAMFYIGYSVQGRGTAYLLSFLYALHPVILLNGRRAMMEGAFLCFSLWLILSAIWLLRHHKWWLYLLTGLFSGLSLASKHTAAFIVITVFLTATLYPLWQAWQQKTLWQKPLLKHFVYLFGAGIFALIVFYALNPAWWGDPLARAGTVLAMRQDLLDIQIASFDSYENFSEQLAGFWQQVFVAHPMYYEVAAWQEYIGEQIIMYEQSGFAGIVMGGSTVGAILLLCLCLFGLFRLLRDDGIHHSTHWLIVIWLMVMLLLTIGITPLQWQRYYLPVYPILLLLTAIGMHTLITTGWQRWTQR